MRMGVQGTMNQVSSFGFYYLPSLGFSFLKKFKEMKKKLEKLIENK